MLQGQVGGNRHYHHHLYIAQGSVTLVEKALLKSPEKLFRGITRYELFKTFDVLILRHRRINGVINHVLQPLAARPWEESTQSQAQSQRTNSLLGVTMTIVIFLPASRDIQRDYGQWSESSILGQQTQSLGFSLSSKTSAFLSPLLHTMPPSSLASTAQRAKHDGAMRHEDTRERRGSGLGLGEQEVCHRGPDTNLPPSLALAALTGIAGKGEGAQHEDHHQLHGSGAAVGWSLDVAGKKVSLCR